MSTCCSMEFSPGHYVAECISCGKHWNKVISKRDNESVNQSNRRIRPSNQTGLEDFIESTKSTTKRKQDIDQSCCCL
ncbi:17993_t:CDS:2 [Entrophospora sp. SA101]|nr:17993_t:CDS:2 [Entrophospora sp. SA101]